MCVILPNLVVLGQTVQALMRCLKNLTHRVPPLKVTQGHRNRHGSIRRNNYGPISYRLRDKQRFQSKIAHFPTPVYLAPLWKGSPCSWVSVLGVENTRVMGLPGWLPRKKFDDIFSRLDTIHERDGRTDGRTTAKTTRW